MKKPKLEVGWREWVALPELGIPAIKAKIDTGARTSAVHAFSIQPFLEHGRKKVGFGIHPLQRRKDIEIFCVADLLEQRLITSSSGQREQRYVIRTPIRINEMEWPIEITLTNRSRLNFRMLLGRTAMRGKLLVNPSTSFLTDRTLAKIYQTHQKEPM